MMEAGSASSPHRVCAPCSQCANQIPAEDCSAEGQTTHILWYVSMLDINASDFLPRLLSHMTYPHSIQMAMSFLMPMVDVFVEKEALQSKHCLSLEKEGQKTLADLNILCRSQSWRQCRRDLCPRPSS